MIQKPRTRYFLIMFSGINKQRQPVSATIEYPGKAYPSKEKIAAHIKREYGCEEYYLRNILELNREDFESYTGVKELSHGAKLFDSYSEIEKSELEKVCIRHEIPYTKSLMGVLVNPFDLTSGQTQALRDYMAQQQHAVLTNEVIMNTDIQSPHEFMRAKNPESEGCGV